MLTLLAASSTSVTAEAEDHLLERRWCAKY